MKFKHSSRKGKISYQKKRKRKILDPNFSLYLRLMNFQRFSNIIINLKPDTNI